MNADELLDQLSRRDLSHCLAVAAVLKHADPAGTPFADVAVTYREDYLHAQTLANVQQLEAGTLAMDDVRRHLATSVLPRLATEGIIDERIGWSDATRVKLRDDILRAFYDHGLPAEEAQHLVLEARSRLVRAAAQSMLTHDTGEAVPAAPATGGSSIEGVGLTKTYGGRTVVNDVNVRLAQGEIVGMLGPNGAGKTTTFYMLVGLIRPQSGKILLDGSDIGRLPMYRRARRGIGYLAQEPSVFRKLTVEENVMAILETMPMSRGERRQRLEELLDELSLKHLRRNKAYSLSGGERRRLEITRALCTRPKFMLLDEPFSGVDPIAVHDIQKIVAGLRHRGIGVLITDHNVEQTLDIVDRAYIMFEGKVQVAGTVRELVFDDRVAQLYLGPTLTARLRERLGAAA